jgi:REP element-mobilizing transposase RayT
MARPLRLDHAGAVWHVTSRGNERREIFRDDEDRERFLTTLGRVIRIFRWRVHAYVLMGNHYHLLVETPEANLSRGMRHLNGVYTQEFNRRHGRVGHLLQGRFKAIHEAALKLLEFSPPLGIQGWAASQLATAAERLARENRCFQQSLRRIQRSLAELTNPET